jgi:tetratricopeptide (TPR) repeat protein
MWRTSRWSALLLLSLVVVAPARAAGQGPAYAYGSEAFTQLALESYRVTGAGSLEPFYRWFEEAYARTPGLWPEGGGPSLRQTLEGRRREHEGLKSPQQRARLERQTAAWVHRLIKTLIPRFSLERGYEFAYAVRYGERQCLLQSVLAAALLQRAGMEAGAVMVWKSPQGQVSNNGHVSAVLRLSDGRDLLVDASEPQPFPEHQGLFTWDGAARDYRFLEPLFAADHSIRAYRLVGSGREVPPSEVAPLSLRYLRSQFYYYRGERAPGGFIGPSNPQGLAASARFLEEAVRLEPHNPLAVYVLGLVYRKQGQLEAARRQIRTGYQLYQRYGFIPEGPRAAYVWAGG